MKFYNPKKAYFKNDTITDTQGLTRAYAQGDAYVHGNTLYISGSHTAKDFYDDVTKVPFWGDLQNSTRFQEAEKFLKDNPQIERVVGHSLGSSASLELQKKYPYLKSRTYSAPVFDPIPNTTKTERYRNIFDPVAMFDNNANNSIKWDLWNDLSLTHSFKNLGNNFTNTETRQLHVAPQAPDNESYILTK